MILENKIYNIILSNNSNYAVVAKSLNDALNMMAIWRPNINVIKIEECSSAVLTQEDIDNAIN